MRCFTTAELEAYVQQRLSAESLDARRYRALVTRHAYAIVTLLIGERGYNSAKARSQIDAFADLAAEEVAAFDAMTPEQRDALTQGRISELRGAASGSRE